MTISNVKSPRLYQSFELPSNYYKKAIRLAEQDFHNWERKISGIRQCHNTISSCEVGSLAEAAVIYWLKATFIPYREEAEGLKFNKVHCWGMKERETGVSHYSKADIEFRSRGKGINPYRLEVKGVRPHQGHGQITQYHAKKYKESRVGNVVFVEVDHDEYRGVATCKIYKVATPKECLEAPLKPNFFGDLCHTLNVE